jgi:hypothetical protein
MTLWKRLSQHKGVSKSGGGNHRGSIFRRHVGGALMERQPELRCDTWGGGASALAAGARAAEHELEQRVSEVIRQMPFVVVPVDDEPGPGSSRGYIERNAIALLSNWQKDALDAPSRSWLGSQCPSARVRGSGLWNSNHVDETYDPAFLDAVSEEIDELVRCKS